MHSVFRARKATPTHHGLVAKKGHHYTWQQSPSTPSAQLTVWPLWKSNVREPASAAGQKSCVSSPPTSVSSDYYTVVVVVVGVVHHVLTNLKQFLPKGMAELDHARRALSPISAVTHAYDREAPMHTRARDCGGKSPSSPVFSSSAAFTR